MNIGDILREKRRSLGLTQEQVANSLGITAPAVNKWEKGLSCPDITLLPVLARLLKTDPNTLLCFRENLTDGEITHFLNEVAEKIRTEGYRQGFSLAMEKLREYPHCTHLRYSAAMLLEGSLLMASLPPEEAEACRREITTLYEQTAQSEDSVLANSARYMLASKYLQKDDCAQAQALLDQMPKKGIPDKRSLQADLLAKQGKPGEAAMLLERMVLNGLQEILLTITKLIPLLVAEGKTHPAEQLAQAAQTECTAYHLWQYDACLAPMQLAAAKHDAKGTVALLAAMLEAVETSWNPADCPLYCHQPYKENPEDLHKTFLPPLLADLENNPMFAFLQEEPAFRQLVAVYRAKVSGDSQPAQA